jgi:hypothetical protein
MYDVALYVGSTPARHDEVQTHDGMSVGAREGVIDAPAGQWKSKTTDGQFRGSGLGH